VESERLVVSGYNASEKPCHDCKYDTAVETWWESRETTKVRLVAKNLERHDLHHKIHPARHRRQDWTLDPGPWMCPWLPQAQQLHFHIRSFPVENKTYTATLNMTGRGKAGLPPLRPTTRTDPTSISRPVPRKRAFPIRSFGPGALIEDTSITDFSDWDARRAFWEELDRAAKAESGSDSGLSSDVPQLLSTIRHNERATYREDGACTPEPTWGFYVCLTDYDPATRDSIPRAMENWVKVIQRDLRPRYPGDSKVHSDEAFRRLRLDLIEDEEALNHASVDRVRECFRALVRSFELTDDEDEWAGPPRNKTCFVLNAQKVQMLADLTFCEDVMEESRVFGKCRLTAVDIYYRRPEMTRGDWCGSSETRENWRGFRDLEIIGLDRRYQMLDNNAYLLDELSD
jgi:hypothetical protein